MSEERLTGPGADLAARREALGLSQREVADALNLPVIVVDAIEVHDLERLPALVFAQGYVRAYAKFLELDQQPLVTAFAAAAGGPVAPADAELMPPPPARLQLPAPPVLLAAGGVFVLLIILLVWYLFAGESDVDNAQAGLVETELVDNGPAERELMEVDPGANPEVNGANVAAVDMATVVQQLPVGSTPVEAAADATSPPSTGQPLLRPAVATVNDSAATEPDTSPSQAMVQTQIPATATLTRRLTAAGDEQLELTFDQDCWVEIKDTSGNMLFADLGKAGRLWRFQGQGPFQIILGYAPATVLRYNGETVTLAPHTRNNVASLVLGQ